MANLNEETPVRSGWREIIGIVICALGLMLFLGIISYNPADIATFQNQPEQHNLIGPVGAYAAYLVFIAFGVAGYVIPFCILGIGVAAIFFSARKIYPRFLWFVLGLFCLSGLVDMNYQLWDGAVQHLNIGSPGGVFGEVLAQRSIGYYIGHTGAVIIFLVFMVIAVIRMIDIRLIDLFKKLWHWAKQIKVELPESQEHEPVEKPAKKVKEPKVKAPKEPKVKRVKEPKVKSASKPKFASRKKQEEVKAQSEKEAQAIDMLRKVGGKSANPAVAEPAVVQPKPKAPASKTVDIEVKAAKQEPVTIPSSDDTLNIGHEDGDKHKNYQLPPFELLDPHVSQDGIGMSADEVTKTAQTLQDTLEEFGVEAKVTGVQQGPVVTCYEVLPAPGVRVERIKSLTDNIALSMRAESIRIQAPIPGKGVCGIEIPNGNRASVFFRDLVGSQKFQSKKDALPLILGSDVSGDSMIHDLAKMPHLLIAGATGAGKSVCMNSILTGLLMRHTPETLRMILVDPKTVEFHAYNDLPHLVVPVITDAKKVALGLKWAIDEMEKRFAQFRKAGVRDLASFNAREIQKQEELFDEDDELIAPDPKDVLPDTLPYVVIVIDELADLMAVAQAEIEAGIARLAAKSRAAGIHMILATQRPDVKVITGTIKANFPVRIAFKVSQKVDSRTILDRMGADALLGKGDMLVLPPGSDKLIRSQGAFTSDGEIERVTNFCKEQGKPDFITEIKEKMEKPNTDLPEMDNGEDDDIIEKAMEVIRQTKRASTSSLQRRLRIGYTRAARVMDLLEERGVIGPPEGAGPREILIDLEGEIPQNSGVEDNGTD